MNEKESKQKGVTIKKHWEFDDNQTYTNFSKKYCIHKALRKAKDLPVVEMVMTEMYIAYPAFNIDNLRDFVQHAKMVNDADLSYPVLMNQDGHIIDGRHRLAKALLTGAKTIKVKRFKSDPESCYEWV